MNAHLSRAYQDVIFHSLFFLLLTVIGAIGMLWLAIDNGYPFLYPDSSGYIGDWTGLLHPIGYNIFLYLNSFGHSLWIPAFFQAWITTVLLMRNASLTFEQKGAANTAAAFLILAMVILVTDITQYASWIMPDIMTSWIFLGGWLFLRSPQWQDRSLASIALLFSLWSHLSHVVLGVTLLFILGLAVFLWKSSEVKKYRKTWIGLAGLWICIVILICGVNFKRYGYFALSYQRSANFFISHMIRWGVVSKVLDDQCPERKWKFCDYRDQIALHKGDIHDWFLWTSESPIQKLGRWNDQKEQNEILSYASRHYFLDIMHGALQDGWIQLGSFNAEKAVIWKSYQKDPEFYDYVGKYYPREIWSIRHSRQAQGILSRARLLPFETEIGPIALNSQWIIFAISVSVMIFLIFSGKGQLGPLILSAVVFIGLNGLITGGLSGAVPRYQGRVMWLLAYCLFLTVAAYLIKKGDTANALKLEKIRGVSRRDRSNLSDL